MRLSVLRKLVEQLSTGGGQLDYAATQVITVPAQGDNNIEPLDPTVANLVIVTTDLATDGVSLDVSQDGVDVTVAQADGVNQGVLVLQGEVPPGATYSISFSGLTSSVTQVYEVPRH